MAFSTSTVIHSTAPIQQPTINDNSGIASLLTTMVITMYAAQKSKKQMRQLKRRALLTFAKLKLQATFAPITSLFSKKPAESISNKTLLYILLGLAVLILLFISWPAAIVLLLLGILLVLLMK